MRIFVASWFFPPNSSSEGFVTYKLLRNSKHDFDVVCSTSKQWGYRDRIDVADSNIRIIQVETEELKDWRDNAVEIFEREHRVNPYSAIMTRSMPPEALEVGLAIKRLHPDVRWIASMGDPVCNNPYCVSSMKNFLLEDDKDDFLADLSCSSDQWNRDWTKSTNPTVALEGKLKKLQERAMVEADAVICPSAAQREYMLKGNRAKCFEVIPHSYDERLYSRTEDVGLTFPEGRINIVYLGYSDALRSLMPLVWALKKTHDALPDVASRISLHVIGNNPPDLADLAESFQLPTELLQIHGNCSYWQSLAIMKKTDWLVHVDAYFSELAETGGSIFFAGKLADYIGAGKPILALTGAGSPADVIVRSYGGISCESWNGAAVQRALMDIALGRATPEVNPDVRVIFDAVRVSRDFDQLAERVAAGSIVIPAEKMEIIGIAGGQKVMTVCIPCYNGEKTLKRCVDSLLRVERPGSLDIIIVDDGSKDGSAEIARGYVASNPGVVRLIRKPNGGHGSGINAGIDHAAGLYFRVVDADDWVDPFALSAELDYLEGQPKEPVDICYSEYRLVDSKTGLGSPWNQEAKVEYGRVYQFEELDLDHVYFTMAGTAFRTSVLRESGVRCREHCFYTDSEYILKPIPFVRTAVFLKGAVYRYWRGQEGQSVSFASFVRNFEDHNSVVKGLIGYSKTTEMSEPHRKYFDRLVKEHLKTHYRIMLELDSDKTRGRMREKDFNAFLRAEMPVLYLWALGQRLQSVCLNADHREDLRFGKVVRKLVKYALPYGLIRLWQKRRYGF